MVGIFHFPSPSREGAGGADEHLQPAHPPTAFPSAKLSVGFNDQHFMFLAGACWSTTGPTFHGGAVLGTRAPAWDRDSCSNPGFLPQAKVLAEGVTELIVTLPHYLFSCIFINQELFYTAINAQNGPMLVSKESKETTEKVNAFHEKPTI